MTHDARNPTDAPTQAGRDSRPRARTAADIAERKKKMARRPQRSRDARRRARTTAEAVVAAEAVAKRVNDRAAQVRRGFIERVDLADDITPLAQLLRGGRGGAVRLKLYLSLLWFAAGPPYAVMYPTRAWATLLGLPEPETNGARRIADALTWLERNGFVRVDPVPGRPSRVTLLNELGTGAPYEVPGAAYNRLITLKKANVFDAGLEDDLYANRYVRVPATFWTSGALAALSGAAVAMFLVLLCELVANEPGTPQWLSPAIASKRYLLSEDTRSAGLRELTTTGITTMTRQSINRDVFDFRRLRNVYTLQLDTLNKPIRFPTEQ